MQLTTHEIYIVDRALELYEEKVAAGKTWFWGQFRDDEILRIQLIRSKFEEEMKCQALHKKP